MPTSVVEHFKLDRTKFDATQAFDSLVEWDSKYFVDPYLLEKCTTLEFQDAHRELVDYFSKTIKLIGASTIKKDLPWREALRRLCFKEIGAFGLGYANESISGSGIGPDFSMHLIETLKEIYDVGVKDPELFELLGLFQEGVGADRISDMTCFILIKRFLAFTERVFNECNYQGPKTKWAGSYLIPPHPYKNRAPILLVPKEILDSLPTVEDGFDISNVYAKNIELRDKLNQILGNEWQKEFKKYRKTDIKDFFVRHPEFLQEIVDVYKTLPISRYDFSKDPTGEFVWREFANKFSKNFPLALSLGSSPTLENVYDVVNKICEQFKKNIEENGAWEILFDDNGKPRKERITQRFFFTVADYHCRVNNIEISPESNAGLGPVDFKLSRGANDKVVIEVKLSSNSKMISGFEKQLEAYKKSESAQRAIFLVILVSLGDQKRVDKLLRKRNDLILEGQNVSDIIVVDGTPKISASKL